MNESSGSGGAGRGRIPAGSRNERRTRLETTSFDVVVIGGGITGAGIAREAALRGLSVALLEADDFAAGTSSRSSKLIHGGLRYLAHGDVALVRETALERKRVHRLAPHLAEPCWMLTPARSRAALLKFRAGIGTYETLGAVEEGDRHHNAFEEELARVEPLLRRDRFSCACLYREYLSDDARLVLANLRDAVSRGATVLGRAPVQGFEGAGGRIAAAIARCAWSGEEIRVAGRVFVNAAGPWVESLLRMQAPDTPPLLHLSKGIHVVVPKSRLPVHNLVILGAADKRSIFAIPRGDAVYLGTTDTSYEHGAELWPEVTRAEVEYLLEPIARYFDTPPLDPEDCVGAWSGLRPLIAEPGKAAKEISRKDEIWVSREGLVTIAGGKLTGYCRMAEQVVERVAPMLGRGLADPPSEPGALPGGEIGRDLDGAAHALAASAGIEREMAERLVRLYGAEAREVLDRGALPLVEAGRVCAGEIDWAVEVEAAETLVDVVYRRTRAGLYQSAEARRMLEPAATRMAGLLGWDASRRAAEVASARSRLDADLAFRNA